jgi:hypothetical protein
MLYKRLIIITIAIIASFGLVGGASAKCVCSGEVTAGTNVGSLFTDDSVQTGDSNSLNARISISNKEIQGITEENCSNASHISDDASFSCTWVKDEPVANSDSPASGGVARILPACTKSGDCRDVSVFIELAINIASYLFGLVGALALGVFVYGGVMIIISAGNSEKLKAGWEAFLAAIMGIVVAFGGYALVKFLAEGLGVGALYKLF